MSAPLDWVLVTGNANKRIETERILQRPVGYVGLDLPEIQSNDLIEVLEGKAEEAWRRLRRPVVVEETGLYVDALNGFPGPLVKWMLEAIGAAGIAELAASRRNTGAEARCAVMLRHGRGRLVGVGSTRGSLVLPPRGERGFGWDPVFLPDGSELTYGELGDRVKDEIGHRGRAWRALMAQLEV